METSNSQPQPQGAKLPEGVSGPARSMLQGLAQLLGVGEQEIVPDASRRRNTLTFTIIGTLTLLGFAIGNMQKVGDARLFMLGVVQVLQVVFILAPAIVLTLCSVPPALSENLLVAGGFVIFASNIIFGGQVGDSPYWTFVFPYLVFFLRGQRTGWIVGVLYAVGVPLLMDYSTHHWGIWPYQEAQSFYYGIAYFFNVVTAAHFNLLRSRFQAHLWEQVGYHTAEVRRHLEALQHNARHDLPSGLLNRQGLLDRLGDLMAGPDGGSLMLALVRFARVPELSSIVGPARVDACFGPLARRLELHLDGLQTLGRVGQDTLGLVLRSGLEQAQALRALQSIAQLEDSAELGGFAMHVELVFGVASQGPGRALNADALMRNAEQALLYAVGQRLPFQVYDDQLRDKVVTRNRRYEQLHEVLLRDGLMLHYQPQVDLRSGRVVGAEALARWQVPGEGMVPPDAFIPIIESTGLLRQFSVWSVRRALADCAGWQEQLPGVTVSVNLSADALHEPEVLQSIERVLERGELDAALVVLELTESVLLKAPQDALARMQRFRALGVQLSIDDYGAGFSSLTYLKQLPAQEMKIDKSFVENLLCGSKDQAIVVSSIELGHDLGLKVLAEGIEDETTCAALRDAGCDLGQGWLFAKALSRNDFVHWALQRNAAPARESA